MAAAFRTKTWATGTATSVTPTEPTGAAQGDIIFVFVITAQTSNAINAPDGTWTAVSSTLLGSAQASSRLFWIRRGASAPTYNNFNWGTSTYYEISVSAWSGCKSSGNPWDQLASTYNAQTSSNGSGVFGPINNAITPTVAPSLAALFGQFYGGNVTAYTAPSTYTRFDGETAGEDICCAWKSLSDTSTQTPGTWSGGVASVTDDAQGYTLNLIADGGTTLNTTTGTWNWQGNYTGTQNTGVGYPDASRVSGPRASGPSGFRLYPTATGGTTSATVATTDAPDTAGAATTVTTGAAVAATDGHDTTAVVAANWTTGAIAASDAADTAAVGTYVTLIAGIAGTDAADTAAVGAANWTTSQVAAADAPDVLAAGSSAAQSAGIAATDAADTLAAVTSSTQAASVASIDGADTAALVAANWTTADTGATDSPDVASVAATVWTSGDIILTDAADVAAAVASAQVNATIGITDAPDLLAIGTPYVPAVPQDAGRHKRRRYAVREGDRLLVFDTPAQAQAAREAIDARAAKSIKAARKPLPIAPKPAEVLDLGQMRQQASAVGVGLQFERLLLDRKLSDLIALYHDLGTRQEQARAVAEEVLRQRREEEDIAIWMLQERAARMAWISARSESLGWIARKLIDRIGKR
jgi:hypothetical protein